MIKAMIVAMLIVSPAPIRRTFIVLALLNLVTVLSASGAIQTDKEAHGLKGPVGSVRVEVAKLPNASSGSAEGPRARTEKRVYDEKGNLVWETEYDGEQVLASRFYSRNPDGTQLEIAHVRRTAATKDSPTPRGMSTSQLTWTHKTDAAGNRIESNLRSADGEIVRTIGFSYDASGKLTSITHYGNQKKRTEMWICNGAGEIKERVAFDDTGASAERDSYSFEYDNRGNWIKRVTSRQAMDAGKAAADPIEITYRSITYYQPVGDFQKNGGVIPGGMAKGATPDQGLLLAHIRKRAEPVFPAIARSARVSGVVTVEVTVDEEGDVLSARAISGHPLLKEAALDAAWDWKFSPVIYAGRPVKVIGAIEFNFHQ